MCGVDHDALGLRPFASQPGEDAVEDPHPAPADEAVVERLVRAVAFRRVFPLKTVLDDVDDAAHHAAIINPWHAMRQRKIRSDPSHLRFAQQKQATRQSLLEKDSESHSLVD